MERGKDELLHEMALRLTEAGKRCAAGCAGCPMANTRDENNNCLIRRIAKVKNAEEQIKALCDWAWKNPPMPELLPCPFCGGEAERYENVYGNHVVRCKNNRCIANTINMAHEETEDAAQGWNRRVGNG